MINVRGCAFPADRFYHAEYNVWLQHGADGVVTLGATSYGVALAIEFFAFMPKPIATTIEAGRAVGVLELSKTVVSVRSPVAGALAAVNAAAMAKPAIISADPYGEGWLVQLATTALLETIEGLVTGDAIAAAFESAMALDNFDGPRSA